MFERGVWCRADGDAVPCGVLPRLSPEQAQQHLPPPPGLCQHLPRQLSSHSAPLLSPSPTFYNSTSHSLLSKPRFLAALQIFKIPSDALPGSPFQSPLEPHQFQQLCPSHFPNYPLPVNQQILGKHYLRALQYTGSWRNSRKKKNQWPGASGN